MRKIRNRKNKKQKKMLIVGSLSLLLFLCVGYAAFSTNLTITAKGNIKERNNLYVSASGSDTKGNGTREKPYQTIQKAYNSAWENATIYIMDNIKVDKTIEFNQEKNIILTSENNEINSLLRGEEKEIVLHVTSGEATLINITLDGQNKNAEHALLRAYQSVVNLNEGTTIKNNIDIVDHGGGINLNSATINVNGARIINNKAEAAGGGGINARHATLTINSGEISENTAVNGGGGIFFGDLDGIFTVNGGIITNNITTESYGGGVAIAGAKMIMNGGEISYNNAPRGGGISLTTITGSDNQSTVTIKEGTISNNNATYFGGGICVNAGHTYNYVSGTITNNIPDNVYNNN